jgi:hypothetical protein
VNEFEVQSGGSTRLLIELLRDACATAAAQYEDYYKSFAGLDSKAIAAGTVAGIIFGALVAFLNKPSLLLRAFTGSAWHEFLLFFAPLGAFVTIILSVIVVQVRDTAISTSAQAQIKETHDLSEIDRRSLSLDHIVDFYLTSLSYSESALKDMSDHVSCKGTILRWAQGCLLLTLLSTLALVWIFLLASVAK